MLLYGAAGLVGFRPDSTLDEQIAGALRVVLDMPDLAPAASYYAREIAEPLPPVIDIRSRIAARLIEVEQALELQKRETGWGNASFEIFAWTPDDGSLYAKVHLR